METNAEATPTALLQSYDGVVYPNSKGYTPKFLTKSTSADQGDWETWTHTYTYNGNQVTTPWNNTGAEITSFVPIEDLQDIKKSSGWVMLAGKFEQTSVSVPAYYVFYNQLTSVLKLFYYVDAQTYGNTCFWTLMFEGQDGQPQKMFALQASTPEPINRMNGVTSSVNLSNYTKGVPKGLERGWNCVMTELAYDPSYNNSAFSFSAWNNNTSTVSLEGVVNLVSTGTIISSTTGGKYDKLASGAINIVNSDKAKEFIGSWFGGETKASPTVISAATSVVQSGLSYLVKLFTGKFGGGAAQTQQNINITTRGTISFTGTVETPSTTGVYPITLTNFNKPTMGEIGTWNLTESPTIYISPVADYVPGSPYEGGGEFDYKVRGDYRIQYDVSINPQFQNKLVKHWSVAEAYIDTTAYKSNNANFNFGGAGIGPHLPNYYNRIPIVSSADNTVFQPDFTATYLVYSLLPSMLGTASDSIAHFTLSKPNATPNSTPLNFSPRYFTPPSTINITDEYAHDFVGFQGKQYRVNVTNFFVVNNSTGAQDTIVSSRQYMPRIEWDR